MKFILFDFEVFKHDWLVVFKQPTKEHVVIVNDYEKLKTFYNENKNNIFVGYNNNHYDNFILKAILNDINPYKVSKWLIEDKKNGWQFPEINKNVFFNSLDLMQDISGALGISLKEIESNLGMSIEESNVSFDIDRELTQEEIEETIFYCKHDVDATEKLMEVRADYIKAKLLLINTFGLPMNCISKTNAQLTAEVMNPRKQTYDDELNYDMPANVQLKDKSILELYTTPLDKKSFLIRNICGVEHKLAFGGLHGADENSQYDDSDGEIINADVVSYYPTLIIKYGFACRGIRNPKLYEQIYNTRVQLKKAKDPKQGAYKLVLNTFFGSMGHEYNKLYDPYQCNQICITGQLFLIDLLEKLEPYIKLIQSNTDGIMFKTNNRAKCEEIIHAWEARTGMTMEFDNIQSVYQKDVNNYFVLMKNGEIKSKGAYVKNFSVKYKDGKLKESYGSFTSNSMSILDEAIIKNLLYKIKVEDIINGCNDPIRFQITTKKGPTFLYVEQQVGDSFVKVNNVNRVFAGKDAKYGKLFKVKQNGRRDTIASLPDNCLVFNQDLKEFDINLIDKQWYINECYKRIGDFLGG